MHISIRNAESGRSEPVEKNVVTGRTLVRLQHGERLQIVDLATGQIPAGLKARRGGEQGEDLIIESNGETIEVQGFFAMAAEGDEAVAVEFPGETAQITPVSPQLTESAGGAAFAMPEGGAAFATMAQASAAGASSAGAAAAGSSAGAAAAGASNAVWWVLGGVAVAGGAAAAASGGDDDPAPAPTHTLTASASSANEGADVLFTLATTNVAPGTQYNYTIKGVSSADVQGGVLTGTVTIDANGNATIPVTLVGDLLTEGAETLTIEVAGESVSVTVNDTSTTPQPTFALSASAEAVDEGGDVTFTLATTNVAPGTQYEYTIKGVSSADVQGGVLTGTVTIDANGNATIPVTLVGDLQTEGAETLTIEVAGQSASVTVNDTSSEPVNLTYVLTESIDTVQGTNGNDVVIGSNTTFGGGDVIDGADGYDKLNVTLAAGSYAEGAEVRNIEEFNLRATAGEDVGLSMSDFDAGVQQINIHDARADVHVLDQQSIASVSIRDTENSISLDYDSQVVTGEADALDVAIDEFSGSLSVGEGIESLSLQVNDGVDEQSSVELDAGGVTQITVAGGVAGQAAEFDLSVNDERVAGATLDAREFAGDLTLTGLSGGSATFAQAIHFTRGLEVGETATLSFNGSTYTILLAGLDTETGITTLVVNGEEIQYQENEFGDSFGAVELAQYFMSILFDEQGLALDAGTLEDGSGFLLIHSLDAPAEIAVDVAGEVMVVGHEFDYTDLEGPSSDDYEQGTQSELSTVLLGAGDDVVSITGEEGDVTHYDSIHLGDGSNTLTVGDDLYGSVTFGDGEEQLLSVGGDIGGQADVTFGVANSTVSVSNQIRGNASLTFAGGDNIVAAYNGLGEAASLTFEGDGSNLLAMYGDISGAASVVFNGDGDNTVVADGIEDSAAITFGNGNNVLVADSDIDDNATIVFGDGDNTLTADDEIEDDASITFGDGNNVIAVNGSIADNAVLTFGDGDNTVYAYGDLRHNAQLTFGDGNNTVVLDEISGEEEGDTPTIAFGNGANTLIVDDGVSGANVQFGSGEDLMAINEGWVREGAQISMGTGTDTLALGDGGSGEDGPEVVGDATQTVIDLGEGDDSATLNGGYYGEGQEYIIGSGGNLRGGEGADALTVNVVDSVGNVVARTEAQVTTVTFDGDYQIGDVVSVTIDGVTFSYTVEADDIAQGDAEATGANVADGVLAVINANEDDLDTEANEDITPALSATREGNVLTLTGEVGEADVAVEASGATVEVQQIANASISGFETLNLIALNPDDSEGESWNDNDEDAGDIGVDFALVSDVQEVNLTSEVERQATVHDDEEGITNGIYTEYEQGNDGDPVSFSLVNLSGSLSDAITISANEHTATGNRQVERITINAEGGAHAVGDVITFSVWAEDAEEPTQYSITVTEEDLAGATAQEDANNIAARLAAVIEAGDSGFQVARDGNLITLIGSSDEDVEVSIETNGEDVVNDVEPLLDAEPADDDDEDVYLNAQLAADEDTDNDTLELTIDGTGNFDLALDAAGDGEEASAYEHLVLNVTDSFSHSIDTDDDGEDNEFVGGSITLNGGEAGTSIEIEDVMAKTVTSNSAANVSIDFDSEADEGESEDYAFSVTTLGGDDEVDMRGVVLTRFSQIDLGEGVDRLVIDNGRHEADDALAGSSDLDEDRMFQNVSGVEELEVSLYDDEITLDDDAYAAGFERLYVGYGSYGGVTIGDAFTRDLSVEVYDYADLAIDVYNDDALTIVADDDVNANIWTDEDAAAEITIEAGDYANIDVYSNGSGTIDIATGWESSVDVEQYGDGAVTIEAGWDSYIDVDQWGLGAIAVTAGAESEVYVYMGTSENAADLSITQLDSDLNRIRLEELNQAQNVSVDITVYGGEESTVIADLAALEAYNTDLEVLGGEGGLDLLTVRSNEEWGASESVTVETSDSWAVGDGDASTLDMTIDASAVVADEGVLIDASDETEADLEIIGSESSHNLLLGGAGADSLTGGAIEDLLQGDRFTWVVDVEGEGGEDLGHWEADFASDVLDGGEGNDIYLIAQSQFDTMDTIVGLDLGGIGGEDSADSVLLGAFIETDDGENIGLDDLNGEEMPGIEQVVNNGEVIELTGPDLEAAVATLFQANGWFEDSGEASEQAAGLFSYGDDTYLIAVGEDSEGGFGADDFIVKVTGVTGTLDVSDFYYALG